MINNCHVCHDRVVHEMGGTEAGGRHEMLTAVVVFVAAVVEQQCMCVHLR